MPDDLRPGGPSSEKLRHPPENRALVQSDHSERSQRALHKGTRGVSADHPVTVRQLFRNSCLASGTCGGGWPVQDKEPFLAAMSPPHHADSEYVGQAGDVFGSLAARQYRCGGCEDALCHVPRAGRSPPPVSCLCVDLWATNGSCYDAVSQAEARRDGL